MEQTKAAFSSSNEAVFSASESSFNIWRKEKVPDLGAGNERSHHNTVRKKKAKYILMPQEETDRSQAKSIKRSGLLYWDFAR